MAKLKNEEFKKLQKTEQELRQGALTPDFTKGELPLLIILDEEQEKKTKTQVMLQDLKSLVRQVTNRETALLSRYD